MNKLPAGWQEKTVKDVCTLQNGNGFKPSEWRDTGLPIIRIQNLNGSKDFNYFSGKPKPSWLISPGEILFAWAGTKGVSFGPFVWTGPQGVLNQHIFRTTPRDAVDKDWLYYSLKRLTFEIEGKAHGFKATLLHVSKGDIEGQKLLVPPRHEQIQISQILSTWDKAITTTESLLANSQQQKQALMQQLLTGQKRFAGFNDEWITVEFDELLGIEIGGTPSRSNPAYWDPEKTTSNRWLSIADLKGNLITDTSEYISDLGAAKSNTKLIPAGTIVMSFKLTIGRRAILAADTYTNEAICAFKIKDPKRLSNNFLFHALCLVNFEQDIDQAVKGKTLNKAKLKQLTLNLPSLPEQQKIAQVLSTADAEITNLQTQLAKLKLEKKALMQQLLTGQRRVKLNAETATSARAGESLGARHLQPA